jgi:hypothetical protein
MLLEPKKSNKNKYVEFSCFMEWWYEKINISTMNLSSLNASRNEMKINEKIF